MKPEDYRPSSKLKRLWEIELDLLKVFIDVCNRHNLEYFVIGGTLLGAARHNGFIPWDNDVDVIMPRDDYDRLWSIASEQFKYPYFFQTTISETKENFFRSHAQLRNSRFLGYCRSDEGKCINKGVFIDIFPLDRVPDDNIEMQSWQQHIMSNKKLMERYCRKATKLKEYLRLSTIVAKLFFAFVPYRRYFNFFNKRVLGKYRYKETKKVGNISLGWHPQFIWPKKYFDEYCYLLFEGIEVKAPRYYEQVLTISYGDWRKYPKEVSEGIGTLHGEILFDDKQAK